MFTYLVLTAIFHAFLKSSKAKTRLSERCKQQLIEVLLTLAGPTYLPRIFKQRRASHVSIVSRVLRKLRGVI